MTMSMGHYKWSSLSVGYALKSFAACVFLALFGAVFALGGWIDVSVSCERSASASTTCSVDEHFLGRLFPRHEELSDVISVERSFRNPSSSDGVTTSQVVLLSREGGKMSLSRVSSNLNDEVKSKANLEIGAFLSDAGATSFSKSYRFVNLIFYIGAGVLSLAAIVLALWPWSILFPQMLELDLTRGELRYRQRAGRPAQKRVAVSQIERFEIVEGLAALEILSPRLVQLMQRHQVEVRSPALVCLCAHLKTGERIVFPNPGNQKRETIEVLIQELNQGVGFRKAS